MKPRPSSLVISRQKRKSLNEFVKMGFWIPLAVLSILLTFVLTLRVQACDTCYNGHRTKF